MTTKFRILFFLTLALSLFIRIYYLTQNPQGFDQTEAAFGYNAYSVLKTGRDEYGKFLPLVLKSIGDYKLSGYMYWQVPFIAVFGLNEFSTRLSTATAGIISLLLIYYIVYATLKRPKLALLTLFITSLAPGHIVLSRMAYDPMIALMFYLASLAFFVRWYKTEKLLFFLGCALALCWSLLTYYAVWVLLPFTVVIYGVIVYRKIKQKTQLFYAAVILCLPLLLIGKLLMITQGQRLHQDSTFQFHAQPLLAKQILEDQHEFPVFITRALHNKAVFYPQVLLQNLFKNLSFDLLFLNGDKIDRRFSVPYSGMLYLWMAPWLFLGVLYFWKNQSFPRNFILLGGIAVIFLGSSFSEFGSETERTLFAIPIFSFFISYGLLVFYNKMRIYNSYAAKMVLGCMGVLLAINAAYFNHQYYWHSNVHEPWGRNFGMHQMITLLPQLESQYKKIVIPDSAYIFYYFYNAVSPETARAETASRLSRANFLGVNLPKNIGNYLTLPVICPSEGKLHYLYVCQGTKIPKNAKVVKFIPYRDDQPAFILLEFMTEVSTEALPRNVEYMDKYGLIDDDSEVYWKD